MQLVPDSFGSRLCEFNPCHDPANGQFTVKGQGRCLGLEAGKAARAEADKRARFSRSFLGKVPLGDVPPYGMSPITHAKRRAMLAYNAGKLPELPGYLRRDAAQIARRDRGIVTLDPMLSKDVSGLTDAEMRHLLVGQWPGAQRTELLSVLRHEGGHLDRTPLGSPKLFGRSLSPEYTEEVRAWKNAIRNGRGRIDWNVVRRGLGSYLKNEPLPGVPGVAMGSEADKILRNAFLDRHVRLLKRYAKRVRRASRAK